MTINEIKEPKLTITQRGFAMLEAIKRECGLVSDPEPAVVATPTPYGKGITRADKRRNYSQRKPRVNLRVIPRDGEMRLKEFLQSKNMSYTKAWELFTAGAFNVTVRRVNARVLFVRVKE